MQQSILVLDDLANMEAMLFQLIVKLEERAGQRSVDEPQVEATPDETLTLSMAVVVYRRKLMLMCEVDSIAF